MFQQDGKFGKKMSGHIRPFDLGTRNFFTGTNINLFGLGEGHFKTLQFASPSDKGMKCSEFLKNICVQLEFSWRFGVFNGSILNYLKRLFPFGGKRR